MIRRQDSESVCRYPPRSRWRLIRASAQSKRSSSCSLVISKLKNPTQFAEAQRHVPREREAPGTSLPMLGARRDHDQVRGLQPRGHLVESLVAGGQARHGVLRGITLELLEVLQMLMQEISNEIEIMGELEA
jgi:hypothetical protein